MPNKLSHVRSAVTPILKAIGALLYPRFSEFRVIVLLVAMFAALSLLGLWPNVGMFVLGLWHNAFRDGDSLKAFLALVLYAGGVLFWMVSTFRLIFAPSKISKSSKQGIAVVYFLILALLGVLNLFEPDVGSMRTGVFGVLDWLFTRVAPFYVVAQLGVLLFSIRAGLESVLGFVGTRMSDEQHSPYRLALGSVLTMLVMYWLSHYHYGYAGLVFLTVAYVESGVWCAYLVSRFVRRDR